MIMNLLKLGTYVRHTHPAFADWRGHVALDKSLKWKSTTDGTTEYHVFWHAGTDCGITPPVPGYFPAHELTEDPDYDYSKIPPADQLADMLRWAKQASAWRQDLPASHEPRAGIAMIKTSVGCPGCHAPVCNLCLFNGSCQDCGHTFDDATRERIAAELT